MDSGRHIGKIVLATRAAEGLLRAAVDANAKHST